MGETEHLCTVDGNINWHSHYGKQYGDSSKKKLELPYDAANWLLVTYSKEIKSLFGTDYLNSHVHCMVFTTAKIWKQNLNVSQQLNGSRKRGIYIEYYSAFLKKKNPAIWDNMDEPGGHCDKWNKPNMGKYCIISCAHGL